MNINNQAQFAKDIYQVPVQPSQEVSFDIPQDEERHEDQDFARIARSYVDEQFAEIARNEEVLRSESMTNVAEFEPSHDISEIIRVGAVMQKHREEHPLLKSPIDRESKAGKSIFVNDPQVTQRKFFYMHTATQEEWFIRQVSTEREKCFTLSYDITPQKVQKSATYYDALEKREMNVIATPSNREIRNLSIATVEYEKYARKYVYPETQTRLRNFVRKFKLGHTA